MLCCKNSSQWGHIQSPSDGCKSCFNLQQIDASPSGHEKHQPLRLSGLFSWITAARPRECLLEVQSRACHSHPSEEPGAAATRNGMQRRCQGSQGFEAPTGGLSGAGNIFCPQGRSDWGHLATLEHLRWLQVGQIEVWHSLGGVRSLWEEALSHMLWE